MYEVCNSSETVYGLEVTNFVMIPDLLSMRPFVVYMHFQSFPRDVYLGLKINKDHEWIENI